MPKWLNKSQEKDWEKTKEIAKDSAKSKDWDYIMGIFKRISGYKPKKEEVINLNYKKLY